LIQSITIHQYLEEYINIPLVDVRSPGEFAQGQLPLALNVPLFSNEERAIVGTAYKKQSKEKAMEIGLKFVQPKLQSFIDECKRIEKNEKIIIHCWRGGLRSKSFAEHLSNNGFTKVFLLEGGYKSFRTHVLLTFKSNYNLIVLGGYTGSGKTETLHELENLGEQIIDLEMLANHKGSAFGGLGEITQSSTEQFENNIFWEWKNLDKDRLIWIEDESRNIGRVFLPQDLYANIRFQNTIFMEIPVDKRAVFLKCGYSEIPHKSLEDAILKIGKKIGNENVQLAIQELEKRNYINVAKIALKYYDKRYLHGLNKRNKDTVSILQFRDVDPLKNADKLRKYVSRKA